VARDKASQEVLAEIAARYNQQTKRYIVDEIWYKDYDSGVKDYVVEKTTNIWGKTIEQFRGPAFGEFAIKAVPNYVAGGIEASTKVYK
jgi:hypothetical protein